MNAIIASLVLAAIIPTDYLDSVGIAAYWYKKDSRGKGDSISEQAKPKRFPAFALAEDTFIVKDPLVRAKHLDKVEIWFGDKVYPAKEVFRSELPATVTIKTDSPVEGIKPLEFVEGEPVERQTWRWNGDSLVVEPGGMGTNSDVRVDARTRQAFHQGKENSLLLDKDRNPVSVDFGDLEILKGDHYVYPNLKDRGECAADALDKAAEAIEKKAADAVIPVVIKLEQLDKDTMKSRRRSYSDDGVSGTEADAMGIVFQGGRVLVPSTMTGEDIARIKTVEATFADGLKADLVFVGALAEWNAMVFDLPENCKDKVAALSVSAAEPHSVFGCRAWSVSVENEGGRPIADVQRTRFQGVSFLRGAKFAAATALNTRYIPSDTSVYMTMDENGLVTALSLVRRYGARYDPAVKVISSADLVAAIEGKSFNPEFRPRSEDERNCLVWLGVETVELTAALAREKKAQSFCEKYSRPPLVSEVYAGSPAEKAGLKNGDILLAYRRGGETDRNFYADRDYSGRDWSMYFGNDEFFSFFGITATPWTDVENEMNKELSKFGTGAKITIVYVRDGKRAETELTLEAAPPHYKTAAKSRNRALGTLVKDMTFEVRRFFKFDDKEPGVVIAKIKPGSPAAVAGLKVFELITEVNGEKVMGAKDFAEKIKGKNDLVFAVRRLSQTRMVKISIK